MPDIWPPGGALRSGAGLVTAAMPAAGEDQVRMGWPEIMTLPLGDPGNRDWPAQLPDDLRHWSSAPVWDAEKTAMRFWQPC